MKTINNKDGTISLVTDKETLHVKNPITDTYKIRDNKIVKVYKPYNKPMEKFNLNKFAGEWYLLAAIPQPYESNCSYQKAIYKVNGDILDITNICYDFYWNEINRVTGTFTPVYKSAGIVNIDGTPKNDKINFIVLETDYKTYAIIGSPNRKSGYLLIRNPKMNIRFQQGFMTNMRNRGFPDIKYRLGI